MKRQPSISRESSVAQIIKAEPLPFFAEESQRRASKQDQLPSKARESWGTDHGVMALPKQEPKQELGINLKTEIDTEDDWRTRVSAIDSTKKSKKQKPIAIDALGQSKKSKLTNRDWVKEETPIKREKKSKTTIRNDVKEETPIKHEWKIKSTSRVEVKEETPTKREKTSPTAGNKKPRRKDLPTTSPGLSLADVDDRHKKRFQKDKKVRKPSGVSD